jgi:hypothetical protein
MYLFAFMQQSITMLRLCARQSFSLCVWQGRVLLDRATHKEESLLPEAVKPHLSSASN